MENHKLFLHEQQAEIESTQTYEKIETIHVDEGAPEGNSTEKTEKYKGLEKNEEIVPNEDRENFNPTKKKLVKTEKLQTIVTRKKIKDPAQEALMRKKKEEEAFIWYIFLKIRLF